MKIRHIILFLVMTLMATACYAEVSGKVIDAETGEPVEGAVVFVEWTITKGLPGVSYHETYKIIEEITRKEGKILIPAILNPAVGDPQILIYKPGYVGWRNDFIFPNWKRRTDFKYQTGMVMKMEKFKDEFSHKEHLEFIEYGVHLYRAEKRQLYNAIQWEVSFSKQPDTN